MDIDNETTDDLVEVEEVVEEVEEEVEEVEVEERQKETLEAQEARLKRQLNQTRKKMGLEEPKSKQSDTFDYGERAYLKSEGIENKAERDFVQDEMKASGKPLHELLENNYFKSNLDVFRTGQATPAGVGAKGAATDSVEYWSSKPIDEVPQNMRSAVVNARLDKEQDSGKFYNS